MKTSIVYNHLKRLLPVIPVLVVMTIAAESAQNSAMLLSTLQRLDTELNNASTIELDYRIPAVYFDPGQGYVTLATTLTCGDQVVGYRALRRYDAEPVYMPKGYLDYKEIDYDESGNLLLWREEAKYALSGPDANDAVYETRMLRISPDEKIFPEDLLTKRLYYLPEDDENIYERNLIHLALGRGYARYLETIVSQEFTGNGMLSVQAKGNFGPTLQGTWNLTIDVDNAYLVREAAFLVDGIDAPILIISTDGIAGDNGMMIAASGQIIDPIGFQNEAYISSFAVTSFSRSTDFGLLTELQERMNRELPPYSDIWDYRVSPPLRSSVNNR